MSATMIEDIYPLSPMQQGMLFHSLYEPDSGVYVEQVSCVLRGELDVAAFERAWQQVTERHTALRSAFVWEEVDEPLQVIQSGLAVPLAYEDWRELAANERAARLAALLERDRAQGFDLAEAPLMRLALIRLDDETSHFVWTHHHLLLDGWSVPLLLQEVFACYEAARTGQELRLPAARPYRDYIAWLQEQDVSAAEAYWRQTLAGFSAPTPLTVDRDPGAAPEGEHGYSELETRLSPELTAELQTLARTQQVTLNTLVQGAWALLLSRYSGEDDVVFGATVAGRPADLAGAEQIIGLFINTLPLRAKVDESAPLGTWLRGLQARQAAMRQYEYTPLVQAHEWSDVAPGVPLFESLLVFENYPVDEAMRERRGSLLIENVQSSSQVNYPLMLVAAPGRKLALNLVYDQARFDGMTIERMSGHLRTLLAGFAAGIERPIGELPLLSEAERDALREWNDTARPFDAAPVVRRFERWAVETPDAVALEFDGRQATYAELNRRANRLAHHLRARGAGPDVLVGVCAERSIEMIVSVLAVWKAGGAYLPLDPRYPAERLAFMLEDAQPRVVLVALGDERPTEQHQLRSLLADGPWTLIDVVADWPVIAREPDANPVSAATGDDLAYVIYTSGSTGRPKGTLLEHRGLANLADVLLDDFAITPESRVLQFASFSFDASVTEIVMALAGGAALVLAEQDTLASPRDLGALLREAAITTVTLPPSLLALLPEEALPALQTVVSAGERCPWPVAARWSQGRRFLNGYGPTETTVAAAYYHVAGPVPGVASVPLGRPIANARIVVLDREMRPVPVGVPGELYIGGAGVARGYLNRPELTAQRFVHDSFGSEQPTTDNGQRLYRSGDLGRYLPDGSIEFLGRVDDQVKLRGFRIELGEIEAALRTHQTVRDAAVVVREDRLVAYVVLAEGQTLATEALRAHLHGRLPDHMLPGVFVSLAALPLTPNGKVDRRALPDVAGMPVGEAYVGPRTPEEELIAGLWAQTLRLARVGTHEDFFTLGGHSLLATQLLARLRETFQVDLPLRALFEQPTVAAQATLVASAQRAARDETLPPLVPAPREGEVPLSFAQQRLWFLDQLEPDSPFYNNPAAVRLSGPLDAGALEQTINAIIQRHEALRTSFGANQGRPFQIIAPEVRIELPVVDLRGMPEAEREAEARRLAQSEAQRPFDLARGPLLRASLIRLADDEHVAVIALHHIVSDGWSIGVLVREIAVLYDAFSHGRPMAWPPLPIQYADYAAWQRAWLQGETLQRQLDYWTEAMAGAPALLNLPTDRPRPPVQTANGGTLAFALPPELAGPLRELSRAEGATLFMALLAGFQALLHRYSGQDDILVGTPIAGRAQPELEGLIGFFVNTLVLRARFPAEISFREVLQQVRETAFEAYAHQDLPFETLVEAIQPERNLSHTPLFQVMFALDNTPRDALVLPELTMRPLEAESGTARFDLTLAMSEGADGLGGMAEYNTDLFDSATVERLLRHFATLLAAAVANPDAPVAGLPLLNETERRQLVVEWNDTTVSIPETTFHALVAERVARQPEAPAVVYGDEILSYAALNARANQLARRLRAGGVGGGALVGILLDRTPDLPVAILATLKAGGAFMPLDPAYPPERIRFMLEDARPAVLLTANDQRRPTNDGPWTVIDVRAEAEAIAALPVGELSDGGAADDLAYVIYTSGSTGQPKGALLAHRGLVNLALWQQRFFGLGPGARVLQFSALSFDAAVWEVAMALASGGALVLADPATLASPPALHALLQRQRITIATLPPSLLALLPTEDLPDLATVVAAGEACPAALVARWTAPHRRLVNAYGPTETTVCATAHVCDPAEGAPPIGRPLDNVACYILDERGAPVPIGVPGELHVGGLGVAQGYLNRGELTAQKFVDDSFADERRTTNNEQRTTDNGRRLYRTGDLARWRADGAIEFLGRVDTQVKLRGFRIELGEVEAALRALPGVRDALVVARDQRLLGYVIPGEGLSADAVWLAERREALRRTLPDYMVPALLLPVAEWPRSPSGKIDRGALPAPDGVRATARVYVAPRTETEARLAEIVAELLDVRPVGVEDSFFDLGGHSLLATQLLARVRDQFGVEAPLRALFEQPTVAGLAAVVEQARQQGETSAPAITAVSRDARRMRRGALGQAGAANTDEQARNER